MQQNTWTRLTSCLSSAQSSSDPVDQLLYLVSKTQANFPCPSVSGAWPVHCYDTCLWSSRSFLAQLQWLASASGLHVLNSTLSPQASGPGPAGPHGREGAAVIPKLLAGEGLNAPILVFGNSDPVSSAHKVLFQFKTVPSGFSPASSVKGAMLSCHRVITFHWQLCSQAYILLKPCFHGECLCPA